MYTVQPNTNRSINSYIRMAPPNKRPKIPSHIARRFILLTGYAAIMTMSCSYYLVRDISKQLKFKHGNASEYYDAHFLPDGMIKSTRGRLKRRVGQHDNDTLSSSFPIASHIVTHGHPRTATTLLFNMVAASYFLHLSHDDPDRIPSIYLEQWKRENAAEKLLTREKEKTLILKTHVDLHNFKADNTVIFTAALDREEAANTKQQLSQEGYNIAFIQDMESLKSEGISGMVSQYVQGYQLSPQDEQDLNEYFKYWEIIRQCCGQQMSKKWRNDMMPDEYKIKKLPHHPTCANYDIDEIERLLISSKLYAKIQQYPNLISLNKPSLNDDNLNGTYCSSYNNRVRTEGLSFWGTPGGRPVRSRLDQAIKNEYNAGSDTHTPRGEKMMERIGMKDLWKKPESEKKVWLKQLLNERIVKVGKSYKLGLSEVDDSLEFDFGDDKNDGMEEDLELEYETEAGTKKASISKPDLTPVAAQDFDKTRAIFLISFGEEAAASTLVERCILSIRRRGQYNGYIIVLTDAPDDRYRHVWDENVIVMHPKEEHLSMDNGTPLHFTKNNKSLRAKRFKTFVLDYVDMDDRLDDVELLYYLDIDIMAGDSLDRMFNGLEKQYQIVGHRPDQDVSKLYFVTPLSKAWPLQSGTMIAERGTSRHCLKLWRDEIDSVIEAGEESMDQSALRSVYHRIEAGQESKCQLIRMDNEDYIKFPKPSNFYKLSASGADHANLIHISNSVFAKRIDEEEQNKYIHQILQLSEEEMQSGMYGKAVMGSRKEKTLE